MKTLIRRKAKNILTTAVALCLMIAASPSVGGKAYAATPDPGNSLFRQSYYGLLGTQNLNGILSGTNWENEDYGWDESDELLGSDEDEDMSDEENEEFDEDGMLDEESEEFDEEDVLDEESEEFDEEDYDFEEQTEEEDENIVDNEEYDVDESDDDEVRAADVFNDNEDEAEPADLTDEVEETPKKDAENYDDKWDEFESGEEQKKAEEPVKEDPAAAKTSEEPEKKDVPAVNNEVNEEVNSEVNNEISKEEISNHIEDSFNSVFNIDNHSETNIFNREESNVRTEINNNYNYNYSANNIFGRRAPIYCGRPHRERTWRYFKDEVEEKKSELVVVIVNQIEKEKKSGAEYIEYEGNLYKLEKDKETGELKAILLKAKDSFNVVVPSCVVSSDNTVCEVIGIAEGAFNNSKALRVVIESAGLNGDSVINSLKESNLLITKIKVVNGGTQLSYTDYYKTIFSKANSGKWTIIV